MRARTTLVVLGLIAAPALCVGQHTHQFEIGAFASFTRYDRAFSLDNQIGGGGRLGYFFGPVVGVEFDVGYQQPTPTSGGANANLALGGGSLVLNMGNAHNLFYILGGYSRLAFGDRAGYSFTDNGVHGAIGDRMFLGDRVAVRIEGRAIYSPKTGFSTGNWAGHIVGSAGLSIFTGPSGFRDADQDGIADKKDACPGTPAGAEVDTAGCQRASDTDGDGIDDTKDKCPGTAAGTRVDAAGCPILFTEAKTPVVLRGVTFEIGRSALKPDSYTILDIVAASLVANPDIKIEIAGHTDNTGLSVTNLRLSQARAQAVLTYLATKGVALDRMVAKGYGPTQPVAPNTTPAGRALNRRV